MIAKEDYLRIGKVIGSHALNGRLRIYVITDIPGRFATGNEIYLKFSDSYEKRKVKDFKVTKKNNALLSLEGVDDRNKADSLKGAELCIDKKTAESSRNDLEESSFYYYDLIGVSVFLDDAEYGILVDIMEAGAGDVLIIESNSGDEVMVPFIDSMVNTDSLSDGRIDIYPAEGMLDL